MIFPTQDPSLCVSQSTECARPALTPSPRDSQRCLAEGSWVPLPCQEDRAQGSLSQTPQPLQLVPAEKYFFFNWALLEGAGLHKKRKHLS